MAYDAFPSSQVSYTNGEPSASEHIPLKIFRSIKQLPFELREHCMVYLQEELYSQALTLLNTLLISGNDSTSSVLLPAYVPHPQILTLISTLIVYPSITTRLPDHEKPEAANQAHAYLNHINSIVGSQNAGLNECLQFASQNQPRSRRRDRLPEPDESTFDDAELKLTTKAAGEDSLYNQAEDFWSILGWAFNCSVRHLPRWNRWKLWLELMLDILSSDLKQRLAEFRANPSIKGRKDDSLPSPLLSQYLLAANENRNSLRRIMRAILADGSPKSMAEFPSIWKNETRGPKGATITRIGEQVKIDSDDEKYGDYNDDSSTPEPASPSLPTEPTPSTKRRRKPQARNSIPSLEDQPPSSLGDPISIHLRRRVLALLTYHSTSLPDLINTENLFDLFTEFMRPLPLAQFLAILFPSPLSDLNATSSLYQMLLRPILSGDAPVYNANYLTKEDLMVFYLPFPASSTAAADNAKVSVVIEGLLRLLWGQGLLDDMPDSSQDRGRGSGRLAKKNGKVNKLREAVERGIAARKDKVGTESRKRKAGAAAEEDEFAREVLEASSNRMMALLDMIES
ncbi:hypothetical protein MBLNU457_4127t2 [Dothideomycetes sp. NU457]